MFGEKEVACLEWEMYPVFGEREVVFVWRKGSSLCLREGSNLCLERVK